MADSYEDLTQHLEEMDRALQALRVEIIGTVVKLLTGKALTSEQESRISLDTVVLCPMGLRDKPYYRVLRQHPNIIGFHGSNDRACFVVDDPGATMRFPLAQPKMEAQG